MDDFRMPTLEEATVDELIDELGSRFPYGLVVAGSKPLEGDGDIDIFHVQRRCGITMAIGIAERARQILFVESENFTEE